MNFISTLFKIALPIILQNFLSSFVNMLDTIMVGQLGAVEIAAVGLGNQVFFVMNLMVFGCVSGGSIFIAQFWGKKDLKGIYKASGIMLILSSVITLIFTAAALICPEFFLRLYSKDETVIKLGAEYLRAVAPSYIFFGLSFAFSACERSTEHVRLPAVATIISVIVNGVLNYLLIFGVPGFLKPYGIVGAAFATVISRIIEAAVVFGFAYLRKYEVAVSPKKFFIKMPGFLPKYIKICFPVLLNESLWGGGISMQSSIFAHAGTEVIAAFNITGTISNLLWPICLGCGSATAIIIGKAIGEGRHEESLSLAKKLCGFISVMALVLGLLLIPFTKTLHIFFKVEQEVLHMAAVFLIMKACIYAFDAFNMSSVVGVFRSGGDTVFALIIDVGIMWLVTLPLGWLAVLVWKLPYWAVYGCMLIEPLIKAALGFGRIMSGKWLRDVTAL